jgi:hypothetical protein
MVRGHRRVQPLRLFALGLTLGAWGCSDEGRTDAIPSSALPPMSPEGAASQSGSTQSSSSLAPPPPRALAPGLAKPPTNGATADGGADASVAIEAGVTGTANGDAASTGSASPPPLSGGTLLVLSDGSTAVAADPDRDAIYVVDTATQALSFTVTLKRGDEPGRLVEDGAGRVHVALRSGGALVTIDPTKGVLLDRRPVCPAPRGLAWDGSTDTVWVACATGELVGLPAAGGAATSTQVIERDLRDVLVAGGGLTLSTFRSAELLRLSSSGTLLRRDSMPPAGDSSPHVAWRTRGLRDGSSITVHQEHSRSSIPTMVRGSYGTQSGPIVGTRCSVLGGDGAIVSTFPLISALAFDMAVSPDGSSVAVVGGGSTTGSGTTPVIEVASLDGSSDTTISFSQWRDAGGGELTAVAFDGHGNIVVQAREPAALSVIPASLVLPTTASVQLSTVSRDDPGHDLFHGPTNAQIACASCHPEGGDDGHVWTFNGLPRRTPSLRGTIAGTAPYHWAGDEVDFPTLVNDVFTNRMSGPMLGQTQMGEITQWVQSIPAPAAPSWVDSASAARGSALFTNPAIGCSTCHSGPKFTNNLTVDVGTGQPFQVPPLVGVGWRTPLLHDGCAATLADRFGACATTGHGVTSSLSPANVSDLVSYLESL